MTMGVLTVLSTAAAPKVSISGSFILGRPKFDCKHGVWFCDVQFKGNGDRVIDVPTKDKLVKANFIHHGDGTIIVEFENALAEKGDFFSERGEEVILPSEFAQKFGCREMVILPGNYPIVPNGKYGYVIVSVRTK